MIENENSIKPFFTLVVGKNSDKIGERIAAYINSYSVSSINEDNFTLFYKLSLLKIIALMEKIS